MKVELTFEVSTRSFYVGQKVWCLASGWTKVQKITNTILTESNLFFWLDGKACKNDIHPSLFDRDILNGTQPPCHFKHGDIVMVADVDNIAMFTPVFFKELVVDKYKCYRGRCVGQDWYFWKYCISIEEYQQRLKLSIDLREFF